MKDMTTLQPAARFACAPTVRLRYWADGVQAQAQAQAEAIAIVTAVVAAAGAGATGAATRAAVERDVLVRPGTSALVRRGTFDVAAAVPRAGMSAAANPAPATAIGGRAASALKQHLVRGPSRDPA